MNFRKLIHQVSSLDDSVQRMDGEMNRFETEVKGLLEKLNDKVGGLQEQLLSHGGRLNDFEEMSNCVKFVVFSM